MGSSSKVFALILFLLLALSGVTLIDFVPFGLAQSGTNESGIISSDTMWTQANSPYNLTANLFVNNGVTLTIESGITVNINSSYNLEVNGTLIIQPGVTINLETFNAKITVNGVLDAIGTAANPIVINGSTGYQNGLLFPIHPWIFFGQTSSESIIENSIINLTNINAENSVKISDNTIIGGFDMAFSGGSPVITNNNITSTDVDLLGGSSTVSNNSMVQGSITLHMFNDNNVRCDFNHNR